MASTIAFFPVGNGDMTLITTESGRNILIDMNIRAAANDPDDDTPDVARLLRDRLERDSMGRLYVDTLLISHPDKDHCTGLAEHFHLGPPDEWSRSADKIFVRELWSSPMVFRRASAPGHVLCDDAKAFNAEARRRVKQFHNTGGQVGDGDRILILGEDENGKTDGLDRILVRVDETFSQVNGQTDDSLTVRLLGPLPIAEINEEERLSKNQSSTILQFSLAGGHRSDMGRFLTGGDAEVAIWEALWQRHSSHPDWLSYDILQTPHHCSWRSLSYDSWSDLRERAQVCKAARNALSQARTGAAIIASSKPIKDGDSDPPCIRAKREYEAIAKGVSGTFSCVGEQPSEAAPGVMEFIIDENGPRPKAKLMKAAAALGAGVVGRQPLGHG